MLAAGGGRANGKQSKSTPKIPSPAGLKVGAKSSSDLLLKRFEKDLKEVLFQFECTLETRISEVTMTQIMVELGFIHINNNADVEQA